MLFCSLNFQELTARGAFDCLAQRRPHKTTRQLEGRVVISTNSKLIVASAMMFISSAKAREVVLARFAPSAATAGEENGAVGVALRAHFQVLGQLTGAYGSREKTLAIGHNAPSEPFRQEPSAMSVPSMAALCLGSGYFPTWWLPPEVENRRSAYFEAMSDVACQNGLPVSLLDAVIAQESGYKGWANSGAGAMGMMQIMPRTAQNLGLSNPWDALANMRAGARYLRQQLDRFGRVDLALAAYNAGPERRSLARGTIPAIPETVNYVRTITTNWVRLTQLDRPTAGAVARVAAASVAVRASGYREVSLTTYEGMNSANPI